MSYCRKEGDDFSDYDYEYNCKDEIIFVTKEDMDKPSKAIIKDDDGDEEPGLILPNGDINWSCPCLGGMASGPCGVQFREAFSCFHYSQAEPKGADCYESFRKMQDCMQGYPELYPTKEEEVEKSMDMAGEADAATEEAPAEGEEECATS